MNDPISLPVERALELLTLVALALATLALFQVRRIARLRAEVAQMSVDPAFGCLTRWGGERAWRLWRGPADVVFFDIDFLHEANAQLGYAEVDRRIRRCLAVRHTDDVFIARWYSGDELFAVVPRGDGFGLARRLQASFRDQGLSCTLALVPARENLAATIAAAAAMVQAAKQQGQRDVVLARPGAWQAGIEELTSANPEADVCSSQRAVARFKRASSL